MAKRWHMLALLCLVSAGLLLPDHAYATTGATLQCNAGQPVAGTKLFDDSDTGLCQFVGIRYIFSTVICQFVSMVNVIMSRLYCSIQGAISPIVMALAVLYVVVYGVQMVMGTAQLNPSGVITRLIKMSLVIWLVTDPTFGVSAGISYMFNFFIGFITESTRWVVRVLDGASRTNMFDASYYNPGITDSFKYLDDWIYNSLTGSLSQANSRVIGFFVAMAAVMPSIAMMALYWWVSMVKMLVATLISFLMAVVAVSFLLGLSPIFLSFMLFQVTFNYFDQWVRFMASYSIQVMVSFAILTLWVFTLSLFAPFFNELSTLLFPYQKFVRPAAAIYTPADSWGICPLTVTANPIPHARCNNPNFNPQGPQVCGPANLLAPCYNDQGKQINPRDEVGLTAPNQDFYNVIPPSRVPEMSNFLYYIFYHMLSLLIVCVGFANLQRSSKEIATQLAGPSYVPILNRPGETTSLAKLGTAQGEAGRFMSKELFAGFNRRHETAKTPYEMMVGNIKGMPSNR